MTCNKSTQTRRVKKGRASSGFTGILASLLSLCVVKKIFCGGDRFGPSSGRFLHDCLRPGLHARVFKPAVVPGRPFRDSPLFLFTLLRIIHYFLFFALTFSALKLICDLTRPQLQAIFSTTYTCKSCVSCWATSGRGVCWCWCCC
ncbi:hypothetical protein DL89DRAFT_54547 [Linderina pennispora]|uniref:Uncharacterized protein n=1 Tax=Linderina pennispora TaxID=61395 RepID=A0A1Y1W104_9FUNG|nr:uncharacterized protein DL89DRAFT_54547 [Linderina pennispora]ORX67187.1 hypothetical protein DL89DRAFT_54547 [Linderina pennispora]